MVNYADKSPNVPEKPAQSLLELVGTTEPMKPWDLVEKLSQEHSGYTQEELRSSVLKPLMLHNVVKINAEGNVVFYKKENYPLE